MTEPPAGPQRERFRVSYPAGDRPEFHGDLGVYEVLDLSESGVCLASTAAHETGTPAGSVIEGRIDFRHSPAADVSGVVVRSDARTIAIRLEKRPIPWATIVAEERALLARYPTRR